MRSTAENLLLWEQRIKERIQNGMTIEEWFKKNGISKHQHYYWNQRVNKKQKTDEGMTFADITPILKKAYTEGPNLVLTSDFQIFFNGIQVIVPSNFNQRKWKELTPEERKKNRLIYSIPVLEAFFAWAESTMTGQENLKKAINYTLNHKKYFTNFLLDGRIPLSNNLREIAVKTVALTRKNALFSDSVDGAIATATIFSIINTATANHLDPYKYLEYLFRQLPNPDFKSEDLILDEYLPWSEKMQLEFKVRNTGNEEVNKGEIPRYVLPGDAKTKSMKINDTLDSLSYDFSQERNISQKDIIQTALVEFFRKYGYKQEVRASLRI